MLLIQKVTNENKFGTICVLHIQTGYCHLCCLAHWRKSLVASKSRSAGETSGPPHMWSYVRSSTITFAMIHKSTPRFKQCIAHHDILEWSNLTSPNKAPHRQRNVIMEEDKLGCYCEDKQHGINGWNRNTIQNKGSSLSGFQSFG